MGKGSGLVSDCSSCPIWNCALAYLFAIDCLRRYSLCWQLELGSIMGSADHMPTSSVISNGDSEGAGGLSDRVA